MTADVTHTDLDAIAAGELVDISALDLHHADRLVDRCTRTVWLYLAENMPSVNSYITVLRSAFAAARDTSQQGEPDGFLYETPTEVRMQYPICVCCGERDRTAPELRLPFPRMWLHSNERDALTLMFPEDY
jgi:hypothetical protein